VNTNVALSDFSRFANTPHSGKIGGTRSLALLLFSSEQNPLNARFFQALLTFSPVSGVLPGQPITLAIKAVGDDIDLYINGKYITRYHDGNSYGKGAIGLFAGQGPSEVMFSNAEIWTPQS
jgi:hypothetical protein